MTRDRSVWMWGFAGASFVLAALWLLMDAAGLYSFLSAQNFTLLQDLSAAGTMPPPFAAHWPTPIRLMLALFVTGSSGGIILWLSTHRRVRFAMLFTVALLLFLFAFSLALHTQYGIFCNISAVVTQLVATLAGAAFGLWFGGKLQYLQLLRCFHGRLSPRQIRIIARAPERIHPEGERQKVTTLICMLHSLPGNDTAARPFISETRETLPKVTDIVLRHGGLMEPGINGFSAYWNMPLETPGHPRLACSAALEILKTLEARNQNHPGSPVRVGMSLTLGEGVSGAYQVGQIPHFTVRSAAAMRGALLQAMTEVYGVPAILCHAASLQCQDQFALLPIDFRTLPPSDFPVHLYALMGDAGVRASPRFRALKTLQEQIFQTSLTQDWAEARRCIALCRKLSGAIPQLYDLYETRIAFYEKFPPEEGWDGCFRQPIY